MQGVFQSTLGYKSDKVIINALSTARAEDITISFFYYNYYLLYGFIPLILGILV